MAKYRFADALSSLSHAGLSLAVAGVAFGVLKLCHVTNAQWLAVGFPAGLYYGREVLDQARNIEEDNMLAKGMTKQDARAEAQSFVHAFFVGWDLDGVLDVVVPWTTLLVGAVAASIL